MISDHSFFIQVIKEPVLLKEDRKGKEGMNYMDYQGIYWPDQNVRTDQLKIYNQNFFKPNFDMLEEKQNYPQSFVEVQDGLLDFTCFHSVSDLILGHFQMHRNAAALTENDILYTSSQGLTQYSMLNGKEEVILHSDSLESLDYSKRHSMVTGYYNENEIYVYNIKTRSNFTFKNTEEDLECMNDSSFVKEEGCSIICSGNSDKVYVVDLEKKKIKNRVESITNVNQIDNKEDGQMVAFAMDTNTIQVRSLSDPDCDIRLVGHEDYNFAVRFMDEYRLASGGQDCTTRIWDIRKPDKELMLLDGYNNGIGFICYDSVKQLLICCETYTYVYAYDLSSEVPQRQTVDFFSSISGICFSPNNDLFVTLQDIRPGIAKFKVCDN